MTASVFLSHSSQDDEMVTKIHDAIEAATHEDVWVDHMDIAGGDHWQENIDGALARCTHMLVILSKESAASREVTTEWRDALLRNKPVLPVIIDDVALEAIPARLRIIQPVNLAKDWAGGIKQLADVITRAHKDESAAEDFGRWAVRVTGMIDRLLLNIPISGREKDIETVQRYLKNAPTSILGVGGLGKSRLAVEIVLTQADTNGVVWHVCGDYTRVDDVYGLLREHLGLEPTTSPEEVLKRLRTEPLLVVLDNAESIGENQPRRMDYVKLVNDLQATKGVQVLLTSRTEWEDIRAGKRHRLGEPEAAAAEQIVRDMATFYEINDYKTDDYASALATAARYHPRLIEWAVGKLAKFAPEKVIRELNELKSKDVQERLNEMIVRTVAQMTAEEGAMPEAALRRLVVCRGGFTYEAAGALLRTLTPLPPLPQGDGEQKPPPQPTPTAADQPLPKPTPTAANQPPPQPSPVNEGGSQDSDEDVLDEAFDVLQGWQFVRKVVEGGKTRYMIEPLVSAAVRADETAYQPHYDYYHALARQHHERQDYLGLVVEADNLEAAFEWAMNAGDGEDALWLANATGNFLQNRGRFEQILKWDERVVEKLAEHPDKMLWANAQNSLGTDYLYLPIGHRHENLKRTVAAYAVALEHYTAEAAPLDYATTQNNLGAAYSGLARMEDREGNLRRAVGAYEAALVYRTADAAPLDYAQTHNNLGIAYTDLAKIEDREANLKRAVTAFEAALVYRTADAAPLAYANTQNNLGAAYNDLAQIEDRDGNLKRAVGAYEAALVYRTADAAPLDYAQTQNNLGTAYSDLAKVEEQEAHLKRAVAAYEEALKYWTAEAAPLDYAYTQYNLGITYEDLGDLKEAVDSWRAAEPCFRQMGDVENADLMLAWIADGEERLGDEGGSE